MRLVSKQRTVSAVGSVRCPAAVRSPVDRLFT
jgi:hypothetical protein